MTVNAYEKAVATFEALITASTRATHPSPARLIHETGQHLSSGYRNTAALEAEGFLRRDAGGVSLQGTSGARVALSAFGFGHIAPILPPVLLRLRENTQHTAFLSIVDQLDVFIGPFSIGRANRAIQLGGRYRLEVPIQPGRNTPTPLSMISADAEISHRIHTLTVPVAENSKYAAHLGLLLNPARPEDPYLSEALSLAARQIAQ